MASEVARIHLPIQEMKEMQDWTLGGEGPVEEGMATHSSVLPCRIPWTEEPGWLHSTGLQRVAEHTCFSIDVLRKIQYQCCGISAPNAQPGTNHEEIFDKSKSRNVLQNKLSVLFKNSNVMENKKGWRPVPELREIYMWCVILDWISIWRKIALSITKFV